MEAIVEKKEFMKLDLQKMTETIIEVMKESIPKHDPIPRTVLEIKAQDRLQSISPPILSVTSLVYSAIDLLAYEGRIIIDEGSRGKQYCFLPELKSARARSI